MRVSSLLVCLLLSIVSAARSNPIWQEVQPGVWKLTVGFPEKISLLKAAGGKPDTKGLARLPNQDFPIDKTEISIRQKDGKIFLLFPLAEKEQIFGLGLNFQTLNQRGRVLNLHVDHYGGVDNGRTHAPLPFYVSSSGYGVLVDVAKYVTVYVGTGVRVASRHSPHVFNRNIDKDWEAQPLSDAVEMETYAQGLDIYVFAGPSPMNAVQRYNLFNGGGYLPPKWGLGFTQRVPSLFTQDDILKEAGLFARHNFPLRCIGIEPGWQSTAYPCSFDWDHSRFPFPAKFVDSLLGMGIRCNLWLNPYVAPSAPIFHQLQQLSGTHTVWNGIVPDFSLKEVRKLFREYFFRNHLDIGVSGYKIDEVDGFDHWLWPDNAAFPSGLSGEQMRQVFGLMLQSMTAGWFREKNQRTYGLVRASNAGASSLPYVLYNDYYNHRDFVTALVNSSFSGLLWTPEVRGADNPEEWLRRLQTVCFSPLAMLNAWADSTRPWSFPEVEHSVREVINLRAQLLPYLYSAFAQYRFEGKPVFRAMYLTEGFGFTGLNEKGKLEGTKNPYALSFRQDIKDQYMMGDDILVAPMFTGDKSRRVYLPAGKWYNFYTGDFAGEGGVIEITEGIDRIPLFVRDGALVPMIAVQPETSDSSRLKHLIVRHYGRSEGSCVLYDDDGISFDFEKGACSFTDLSAARNTDGSMAGSVKLPATGKPFGYDPRVTWVFMTK